MDPQEIRLFNFGPRWPSKRPLLQRHFQTIGEVTYEWNLLCEDIIRLHSRVCDKFLGGARIALYNLRSDIAQRRAIQQNLSRNASVIPHNILDDTLWILESADELADHRNNITHAPIDTFASAWLSGYSDEEEASLTGKDKELNREHMDALKSESNNLYEGVAPRAMGNPRASELNKRGNYLVYGRSVATAIFDLSNFTRSLALRIDSNDIICKRPKLFRFPPDAWVMLPISFKKNGKWLKIHIRVFIVDFKGNAYALTTRDNLASYGIRLEPKYIASRVRQSPFLCFGFSQRRYDPRYVDLSQMIVFRVSMNRYVQFLYPLDYKTAFASSDSDCLLVQTDKPSNIIRLIDSSGPHSRWTTRRAESCSIATGLGELCTAPVFNEMNHSLSGIILRSGLSQSSHQWVHFLSVHVIEGILEDVRSGLQKTSKSELDIEQLTFT